MLSDFSPILALAAGILSILSPCVLPLLPVVLGGAQARHRLGPLALGAGLAVSFTLVGLFVATVGFSIGLGGEAFRLFGGVMLLVLGGVLLVPPLQVALATAAGPVMRWADAGIDRISGDGLVQQGGIGLILGMVWAPCVGPTLGAASLLAAQGQNLGQVALTMLAFGLGAALPLVLIGLASRQAIARLKGRLGAAGRGGKLALGGVLVITGLLVVSGLDKALESAFLDHAPAWLTSLAVSV